MPKGNVLVTISQPYKYNEIFKFGKAEELTVAHQFTTRSLSNNEVLRPVSQVLQVKWDPILEVRGQRKLQSAVSNETP